MSDASLPNRLARLEAHCGTTMDAEQRRKLQEAIIAAISAGPMLNLAMSSDVAPVAPNHDQHTGQRAEHSR